MQASQRKFVCASALLFTISVVLTALSCASMSAMGGMPMPGGWTMSMMWMRMPGQTWPGAAASFLGMWVVMMAAMMLPSLVLVLQRYRQQALGMTGAARLGRLTALVGAGYFFVWTLVGVVAFTVGIALSAVEMRQPAFAQAVPIAVGASVLIAGAFQFTAWKAHHLACCRQPELTRALPASPATAWRHGISLGLHCSYCCAGLTAILLVVGVMDLRIMAGVAGAITAERLAPAGELTARAIGVIVLAAGLVVIVRVSAL